MSRIHTMMPDNSVNLDRFLAQFKKTGVYWLAGAELDASQQDVEPFFDLLVEKTELRVVPAWQIDLNDPDIVGVHVDDDPSIPAGVADVPFHRVQRWKKKEGSR